MTRRTSIVLSLALLALIVLLFVTAPPPLPEVVRPAAHIDVNRVLALAEAENDAMRELWTAEIVGAGQQVGLKFSEDWREPGEAAGPLPALFLRETARNLERHPVRLSLFLGSDAPINPANGFEGLQRERFREIRETGEAQFFFTPDTGLHTAMFPDTALAEACVTCHNEHEDSPRSDWQLHDVMGATTWSYPDAKLSSGEMLAALAALRGAFAGTYQAYLEKVAVSSDPPQIGSRWPRDGYYLPAADVFMAELARRISASSLHSLLEAAAEGGQPEEALVE